MAVASDKHIVDVRYDAERDQRGLFLPAITIRYRCGRSSTKLLSTPFPCRESAIAMLDAYGHELIASSD